MTCGSGRVAPLAGADFYAYLLRTFDRDALDAFLDAADIAPEKVLPVDFVNSTVVGGALRCAGDEVREGHQVYRLHIERPVPGVG